MESGEFYTFFTHDDFDLDKSFNCGQCFRWVRQPDGSYTGVARGRAARIWKDGGRVTITGTEADFLNLWRDYFDLDTDYRSARKQVANCGYMRAAADFGSGIRLLRQEGWEALCTFIFSQCNNIARIRGIIERFCECFGAPVTFEGRTVYAFPTARTVAALTQRDLAPLRSGYRASYVLAAAQEVAAGRLDLAETAALPTEEALKRLRALPGVGEKVASCVLLFGLGKRDAFPVDVWMRRALDAHFPPDFDPRVFGDNAGLAQQYIFYMARSDGRKNDEKPIYDNAHTA